jgi:hypothetical protein
MSHFDISCDGYTPVGVETTQTVSVKVRRSFLCGHPYLRFADERQPASRVDPQILHFSQDLGPEVAQTNFPAHLKRGFVFTIRLQVHGHARWRGYLVLEAEAGLHKRRSDYERFEVIGKPGQGPRGIERC